MIPLLWVLYAWIALVALFAFVALFTTMITFRYGLTTFGTYASTAIFLGVSALVILIVCGYITTVDWSQSFALFSTTGLGTEF